jgi:hypothetical protein
VRASCCCYCQGGGGVPFGSADSEPNIAASIGTLSHEYKVFDAFVFHMNPKRDDLRHAASNHAKSNICKL